ncbi:MAG: hypothetical protein QI199_02835 [Candidatus Korarchaeota archaeon]|nr:hypothetical protein [Candidatus Korarchaeota archaeon]
MLALMRLTGRDFRRELRTIESIIRGDMPLEDFVRESLRSLLEYAKKKVPHYSRLLRDLEDPLTHFNRIPVLRRSFVQDHIDDLTSSTDMERMMGVLTGTTGGSTARPIRFFRDVSPISGVRPRRSSIKVGSWG